MSAIASFLRIREADLDGLREVVVPGKGASRRDGLPAYLQAHAQPVLEFDGSGYIFATLLFYLEEKRAIDLMKSPHADLAAFVSTSRDATWFFFTTEHRSRHLEGLDPAAFDKAELDSYYNEFNGTNESGAGDAMLDGIKALRAALDAVQPDSVVFLSIV